MYIRLPGCVFASATLTLHLSCFLLVSEILSFLLCTFDSFCPHRTEYSTMSFFKKLKSEFEEMFGDDDKKKEEKPSQPAHNSKPTESSESLGLPLIQTYSS
jgi:hypothetical protein